MATTIDFSGHAARGRAGMIHYTDDRGEHRLVDLSKEVFTIGRTRDNDLAINHRLVSRHHAEVICDGRDFTYVDKQSRSGSFFAARRISEKSLSHGDAIRLGSHERGALLTFYFSSSDVLSALSHSSFDVARAGVGVLTADLPAARITRAARGISLKRLNAIGEQIRQCADRDGLFETLRQSLLAVFPAADVAISPGDQPRDQVAGSYSFGFPLASGNRAPVVCQVSRRERAFSSEETEFLSALGQQAGMALEVIRLAEDRQRTFDSMIKALALTLDARDEMTAGHSARVANYSAATARHLGLSPKEQKLTYYAALLHDYGKIGIRDEVLCKPSPLTPEEYENIKQHPAYTFHILSRINFGEDLAAIPVIAGSHHERPDGLGYPRGLRRDEIHLSARIIAVTDFFDALTFVRHYRQPLPPDQVVAMIEEGRDTQFDGLVIDAFKRYYEEEYRPRYLRRQQIRKAASDQS